MSENKIKGIMETTLQKLRDLVDADTVVGTPIVVGDTTLIPVSKVTMGLASGGSDFASKKSDTPVFGGGGGAGLSVTPIAFISVYAGNVQMIPISNESTVVDRAIAAAPELLEKVKEVIKPSKE